MRFKEGWSNEEWRVHKSRSLVRCKTALKEKILHKVGFLKDNKLITYTRKMLCLRGYWDICVLDLILSIKEEMGERF